MSIIGISRVAFRVAGGKFFSFQPDGRIEIRDNPNTPGVPGEYETVEVLLLGERAPFSDVPSDVLTELMPGSPSDPPRKRFDALVEGLPFGQQTLLNLEPVLNRAGWTLTPPNAAGDRTKVFPPGGPWTRVGFGEGKWVWIEQPES